MYTQTYPIPTFKDNPFNHVKQIGLELDLELFIVHKEANFDTGRWCLTYSIFEYFANAFRTSYY